MSRVSQRVEGRSLTQSRKKEETPSLTNKALRRCAQSVAQLWNRVLQYAGPFRVFSRKYGRKGVGTKTSHFENSAVQRRIEEATLSRPRRSVLPAYRLDQTNIKPIISDELRSLEDAPIFLTKMRQKTYLVQLCICSVAIYR